MGDARLALLSRVTRARIIYSSRECEFWSDSKSPEKRAIVTCKIRKFWCPGEGSNLSHKSLPIQSVSVVGLFELPRKLPTSIVRCDGTAWYRLGAHEPA